MKCRVCQTENSSNNGYCRNCGAFLEDPGFKTQTYTADQRAATVDALMFRPGEKFSDRYTIIEEIGRGGMGRVYKAEDGELGITVALKMIRPSLSLRPGMIERFKRETLLGRSISHENVIRIHDIGEDDKVKYISMDYIQGENLGEFMGTSGSLAPGTCFQIAVQVCRALRAAHQKGIVHQDLKPQNILINKSGKVFVADFGLAVSLSDYYVGTPKKIRGTPKYFSPEQARGEEPDPRSDIYSLGLILYEMMTSKAPFKAETVEEYIKDHVSTKPAPPSKANPSIPPACEKIILKCLEKKKEDRYQNVDALLKDLEIHKEEFCQRPAGNGIKRRLAIAATAVLALAVGFVVWLTFFRPHRLSGEGLIAAMYAVNLSGDESLDRYLRWQIPFYLYMNLAHSKYLSVLPCERMMQFLSDWNLLGEEHHLSKTLDRIADEANVAFFILPSFDKVGDGFRINWTIRKAKTDENLGEPGVVTGKTFDDLLSMVDDICLKVKSRLNLSPSEISGDYSPNLGQITTASTEALRYYTEGSILFIQRKHEASIESLNKAVQEDPSFALAYLKLATNYEYLGDYAKRNEYLQKALSLEDRLAERERRLILGYSSLALDESPHEAIENYKKLLELYPLDEEGRMWLGAVYRSLEEWDLALEQVDRLLGINPRNATALENEVFIYTAKGWYERALDLCETTLKINPPNAHFFIRQVPLLYLIQARYERTAAALELAQAKLPDDMEILELAGNLHYLRGDLPAARRIFEKIQRMGEDNLEALELRGRKWLAHLLISQGEYGKARELMLGGISLARKSNRIYKEVEQRFLLAQAEIQIGRFSRAVDVLRPVFEMSDRDIYIGAFKTVLHLSAVAALGSGDIDAAKRVGERLGKIIEKADYPKYIRRHEHLIGQIALAEGQADQAIPHLERAVSMLPEQRENSDEDQAFYYDALARAYYQSGNLSKALEVYQAICALTTGRLEWGGLYARSYYWQGRIQQRMGHEAEAVAGFERFLRLWEEADGDLPEVIDARQQLKSLSSQIGPGRAPSVF